jgi:hypothetical protein
MLPEEVTKVGAPISRLREDFHSIAGTENHPFPNARHLHELTQRFRKLALGNGKPLADLDGRGLVIDAKELEVHGRANS